MKTILAILFVTLSFVGFAEGDSSSHRFNLHFQTTYIYQYKPSFNAPYTGANSLSSAEEKQNSITATLYFGARLWKGAELYINPELAGGSALSGAFGLAASTNGETFRVGDPAPTLYLGRAYLQQTFALKGDKDNIDEGANEVGGKKPTNYVKLQAGKFSMGDIFDNNVYANSPRTQFMNWCLMNNGAFDYAANTRGYTYGVAAILQLHDMAYKAALTTLPVVANGQDLNTNLNEEYSLDAEVSRAYKIKGREGNLRLLAYRNDGHMGAYKDALYYTSWMPSVTLVEHYGATKTGVGISADQRLSATTGVFLRAGWNDGKTETWAFTEADRSVSGGVSVNGAEWKRKDDNAGVALAVNGLSADHKSYLAAGGLGFQLGDGKLNYGVETAAEFYYNYKPTSAGIWLSGDYQCIINPGYNSDRGPVNVFSIRAHVEL